MLLLLCFVTFTQSNWKNLFLYYSTTHTININLLNGLLLIHPIILYIVYILYISVVFFKLSFKFKKIYKNPHLYNTNISLLMFTSNVSLVLGCWWAEQELSWGGWWNWDFVELIALNFFLMFLVYFHTPNKTNVFVKTNILVLYLIILVAIIIVRFNIINSIHNFINVGSQNQYLLLFIYVFVVSILRMILILNLKILIKRYNKSCYLINNNFFLYIIIYVFFLLFLCDFSPKSFFFLNLNTTINIKIIYKNIILLYFLWYFFKKNHQNLFWLIYVIIYYTLLYYTHILFIFFAIKAFFINMFFKNNNVANSKIEVWKIHTTILILFVVSTQQIYLYNYILDIYVSTKIGVFKLNVGYVSIYNYIYVITFNNNNSTELLENVFKVGNFLSLSNWKQIFEKNLYIFLNNFIGLYNYNLQFLIQLSGILIYLLVILPISFFKKYGKNFFFLFF